MIHELWSQGIVTRADELRDLVGSPHEAVLKKSIAQIDSHVRNYVSMSPLFFLSTANQEGRCDVSPRGDEPGFVKVIDDRHLIYPERPGNRRVDSLLNMLENPYAGMLFIIPGLEEVLRINGRTRITRNEDILTAMQWSEVPQLGVIVEVEECFIHCPRALKKSKVWEAESRPAKKDLPSVNDMFHAHLQMNGFTIQK
ncbi:MULTISPECIES: MSMEG_1061 family FMN-dependent PPOX-type flavoprotein [Paenibacillus]|uniref:Phosphohydrolase n=1 Tax=Paenibacillus naphthalenovorans TaxID=162209 RepID=A0A0U2U9W7_9BACL|nr:MULTISPECIES: MSMEG_1061 family FMN-dependent PPOX-type flavoprotein [Paenibacillus]ALS23000.1 phosphohydrolase [Paenibacillus naphthalenovorans]NTZ17404.1 pyridoxamine 5'-phosphate oxidase family protein [Paenibacillus sp. JMULE4]GCL71939.1 phosphohydrolase [Paenibacillus naphthalenovorans]SDI43100.1 hypothetical protein SAMN05421868_106121 [Paenibacillus naphthalenovorans]